MTKHAKISVIAGIIFFLIAGPAPSRQSVAAPQIQARSTAISDWLLLGPLESPLPALQTESRTGIPVKGLVEFAEIDLLNIKPASGDKVAWHAEKYKIWQPAQTDENGILTLEAGTSGLLVKNVPELRVQGWSPDGKWAFYRWSKKRSAILRKSNETAIWPTASRIGATAAFFTGFSFPAELVNG